MEGAHLDHSDNPYSLIACIVFRSICLPNQRTVLEIADLPTEILPDQEARYDDCQFVAL